jgi:hypothetical protein
MVRRKDCCLRIEEWFNESGVGEREKVKSQRVRFEEMRDYLWW